MTTSLTDIMAQLEGVSKIDMLHPRALMEIEVIIDRHGASDVATALAFLYCQTLYDNRLLKRQLADLAGGVAA